MRITSLEKVHQGKFKISCCKKAATIQRLNIKVDCILGNSNTVFYIYMEGDAVEKSPFMKVSRYTTTCL